MRIVLLVFLAALSLKADGLTFFIHTPGQTPDGPRWERFTTSPIARSEPTPASYCG